MTREHHFGDRYQHPAIRSIVVGSYQAILTKLLNCIEKMLE